MLDITILTCNFNTSTLIITLLKSIIHTCHIIPKVLVVNTSTNIKESNILQSFKIPHVNMIGGTHGEAVNLGLELISTKYVLLVDSDIIFLRDFNNILSKVISNGVTLLGNISNLTDNKSLYPRIDPWYCIINNADLKFNNIKFFDPVKTKDSRNSGGPVYDIGSTMFEDVSNLGLQIGNSKVLENKYFKHYGGMSWRSQKYNPNDIDTDIDFGGTHPHKEYYNWGMMVADQYTQETTYLQNIDIIGKFICI